MPPEHYEAAVARAVERIRAGALEKIVLAREVQVHAPAAHDAGAVFGVLREAFPSCFVFCAGRGDGAFIAASPELLIRRDGMRATTLALAGSTRRSADPAVDDHLGEQLLRSTKDREEQEIVVAAHRARAARARACGSPRPGAGDRAGGEHPAPRDADPRAARPAGRRRSSSRGCCTRRRRSAASRWPTAAPLIPALEGLDRGWYAGPGRVDGRQRGRRVLRRAALRAAARPGRALLRGRRRRARLRPGRRARRDRDQAPARCCRSSARSGRERALRALAPGAVARRPRRRRGDRGRGLPRPLARAGGRRDARRSWT